MPIRKLLAACWLAFLAAVGVGAAAAAQSAEAPLRARVEAFYEAFASGRPDNFERMATENFTPELLAQSSAERRKARFERIVSDFGKVAITGIEIQTKGAVLTFEGAKGLPAHVDIDMEPRPPYRIAGYLLKVDRANPVAPPPVSASMSASELGSALDAYLAPLVGAGKFSGVVLVARDGSPTVERAYGSAERETRAPNTVETRFNLGSVGKLFTKTAIAVLAADRKLALTDTLGKLIPDYPNEQARTATVGQLLTHRVGIADFFGAEFDAAPKTRFRSNADFYRFVAGTALLFGPGEKAQYCNGCYVVLGAVIERVAGLPYVLEMHCCAGNDIASAGFPGCGPIVANRPARGRRHRLSHSVSAPLPRTEPPVAAPSVALLLVST